MIYNCNVERQGKTITDKKKQKKSFVFVHICNRTILPIGVGKCRKYYSIEMYIIRFICACATLLSIKDTMDANSRAKHVKKVFLSHFFADPSPLIETSDIRMLAV